MSRIFLVSALAASSTFLAACSGGGGGSAAAPSRAFTATFSQLAGQAQDASRVHVAQHSANEVAFTFAEGPLRDAVVICADYAGGACRVVGGPAGTMATGTLEARMRGAHGYAASLRLNHSQNGALAPSHHRLHQAAPGTPDGTLPGLPQGLATYTGDFQAGAGIGGQGGIAEGRAVLTVNFDAGRVSGALDGSLRGTATTVSANFNNLTINPATGQFETTADSTLSLNNQLAAGSVQGGFYGPTAQEAAGAFQMGTASGDGMSGMFLACQGMQPSCVSHGAP